MSGAVVDWYGDRPQDLLKLLVDERVAVPGDLVEDLGQAVRGGDRVPGDRLEDRVRQARSLEGRPASSTRPIEVAYAGKRVPTVMLTLMMRTVGTRATYWMSCSSSTAIDAESCTRFIS